MKIVVYGLTITSSWGNGHATTYRSLLKALARRGHTILFIEKDVEWYRSHRDLPRPEFCTVRLYESWTLEEAKLITLSRDADVVVIGSYFPDAVMATRGLREQVSGPILFYDIDTPITLAGLRRCGSVEYLRAVDIPYYAAYLSFTGGPALQELLQHFGAKQAIGFFCSVDADLYRPVANLREFANDLSYLGTYAPDRQPKLLRLLDGAAAMLPESRFLVAGSQYPPETAWRANVRHLDHIAPADHPAFYSSSRFTLNLTRQDMVDAGYSPSVRLFESSASGAAILSDEWAGLSELFTPGEEILLPKDAVEVKDILLHTSDTERKAIGARARERILAEHSADHRAAQFEQIVATCGGSAYVSSNSASDATQRVGDSASSSFAL